MVEATAGALAELATQPEGNRLRRIRMQTSPTRLHRRSIMGGIIEEAAGPSCPSEAEEIASMSTVRDDEAVPCRVSLSLYEWVDGWCLESQGNQVELEVDLSFASRSKQPRSSLSRALLHLFNICSFRRRDIVGVSFLPYLFPMLKI